MSVYFKCDSLEALSEIWYFHLLQGSILGEGFEPIDSFKSYSNCPVNSIKFYPKGHRPSSGRPGAPGGGKRGTRGIVRISGYDGFIIRNGHWLIKGTPANFDLIRAPFGNYYLKSRTGYCGIENSNGALACNKGIGNAAQFEYDEKKGYLGYAGGYDWFANEYPRGRQQSLVYPGKSEEDSKYSIKLKFVKLASLKNIASGGGKEGEKVRFSFTYIYMLLSSPVSTRFDCLCQTTGVALPCYRPSSKTVSFRALHLPGPIVLLYCPNQLLCFW